MKIKSYKLLFRFFSFLSDKTNGASVFVKIKLVLGTLLISVGATASPKSMAHSGLSETQKPLKNSTLIEERKEESRHLVTCYKPAVSKQEMFLRKLPFGQNVELPPISAEGSIEEFSSWLRKNIKYPKDMKRNASKGSILFSVDGKGNIDNITASKVVLEEVEAQVIKLIEASKPWAAGMHEGKPISTKIFVDLDVSDEEIPTIQCYLQTVPK